jgi:hypothetical protein
MHKSILLAAALAATSAYAVVSTTASSVSYTGNGATTAFTVTFPFQKTTDLVVTVAGVTKALGADYSVTGAGNATGTVTFSTAPANAAAVVIARLVDYKQITSLRSQRTYDPKTVEDALDKLSMGQQQLANGIVVNQVVTDVTSALVTPSGGSTARTPAAIAGDAYNVKSSGALGDGVTNDRTAIQAAVTAACSAGKAVYIPAGTYVVGSTIGACGSIRIFGDGEKTILKPTIADGTPVLNFPAGSTFFKVDNITIDSGINGTNFDAGSASAQQCIGLRVQSNSGTSTYSTRFSMNNVHIRGVKTGFDVQGFIITGDNIWAHYNEVGFKCDLCNSVDLNLRLEDNRQALAITNSNGVVLRQLISEGANTLGVASTIDSSNGVYLIGPYLEDGTARTQPTLSVGGSSAVTDFSMVGGRVDGSSNYATGVYPITLDQVNGAYIELHMELGSQGRSILTTSNTKNFQLRGMNNPSGVWHDASMNLGTAFNYWPNRRFDLWFRGWDVTAGITTTRASISQDTTNVRKGANALRVTGTAAQNFNHADLYITGPVVTALRGKTVRLGVWLWVPNLSAYDESSRTQNPAVAVNSFNGSVTTTSATINNIAARNAWNFISSETLAIQSDATRISVTIYSNDSGTNATGAEYVVVGSIVLADAAVPVDRLVNDDLQDSPLITSVGVGGRMVASASVVPTDTAQTFVAGDSVLNSAPTAGGPSGWVCTAGGSPGTWSPMGPAGIQQATLSAGSQTATVVSGCRAICTDTSNTNAVKCSVSGTTLTLTGTGSDVINYFCF